MTEERKKVAANAMYYWLKEDTDSWPEHMPHGDFSTERYFKGRIPSAGRFSGFHAVGVASETRAIAWIEGVILAKPDAPWEIYERWGMPGTGKDRLIAENDLVEVVVQGPVRAVAVRVL